MYTEKLIQSIQQFHEGYITEQEMLIFIYNRIAERMDDFSLIRETQFDYVVSADEWYAAIRFEDGIWKVVERVAIYQTVWKYEIK